MNIKDYLHLYLGCKALYFNKGFSYEPKEVVIFGYDLSKENKCVVHTGGANDNPSWFKPLLRPLSDITNEEDKECNNIMYGEFYEKLYKGNIIHYEGEKIRYLLSKHFDLFSLIEAGLAIDKTTLKL